MNRSSIADRIEALMRSQGLRKAELSRRSGVSKTYVSDLLSGKSKDPKCGYIIKIAIALGVSVEDLYAELSCKEADTVSTTSHPHNTSQMVLPKKSQLDGIYGMVTIPELDLRVAAIDQYDIGKMFMSENQVVSQEKQMAILAVLNERPFERIFDKKLTELYPIDVLCKNLKYLADCGYVEAAMRCSLDKKWSFGHASITSKGISFFEKNGGLYKKATTQMIEIDQESFRQMLQSYVERSEKEKTVKNRFLDAIKDAPAEGLKTLTGQILQEGLKASPHIWQLIESTLFR